MAVLLNNDTIYNPDLYLSPDQQDLLLAALSSNEPNSTKGSSMSPGRAPQTPKSNSAHVYNGPQSQSKEYPTDVTVNDQYVSPPQQTLGYNELSSVGLDDSSFLDFDLEDGSFDWDNDGDQLMGAIPGTSLNNDESELHDKRKNPDDEKDEEGGGGKRREGDDKSSKKPGRKPLTSEPTTVSSVTVISQSFADCCLLQKRKAQNRAAQRAFRERKERHLKDLETKVDDLEKASESANHENGLLRAQVEHLHSELKGYRKRLSYNGGGATGRPTSLGASRPSSIATNVGSSNNFQFEFPKFGGLPGSQIFNDSSLSQKNAQREGPPTPRDNAVPYQDPGVVQRKSFGSVSPKANLDEEAGVFPSMGVAPAAPWSSTTSTDGTAAEDMSGLLSPSVLQNVSRSSSLDYIGSKGTHVAAAQNSRRSTASSNSQNSVPQLNGGSVSSITTSPSASSVSQHGPGSSCGTSPEPGSYSPTNGKTADSNLNVIDEEHQDHGVNEGETTYRVELNVTSALEKPYWMGMTGHKLTSFQLQDLQRNQLRKVQRTQLLVL